MNWVMFLLFLSCFNAFSMWGGMGVSLLDTTPITFPLSTWSSGPPELPRLIAALTTQRFLTFPLGTLIESSPAR